MSRKGIKDKKPRKEYAKVYEDITGQTFNSLTAHTKSRKNGRWYWTCSCECGNETTLRADVIITGRTTSCGCKKGERPYGSGKPKGEAQINSTLKSYRHSAKKRNLPFDLSKEEFTNLIKMHCYYCNLEPQPSRFNTKNNNDFKSTGIDRVDSNLGYTLANSVPCCKTCNYAKNVMSDDEFTNWVRRIYFNYARDNQFNQMNFRVGGQ